MSAIEDIRNLVQDLVAPELRAINERLNTVNERLNGFERAMSLQFEALNKRFDSLIQVLELKQRVEKLERDNEDKKPPTN